MVSWNDAAEFCAKLSQHEQLEPHYDRTDEKVTPLSGTGYRLPTEAEWEFACRAGTVTNFWSGDQDDDLFAIGWSGKNAGGRTHAVGELKANPFGLFDVHGNVWEWVQDQWDPSSYGQFADKTAVDPYSPFTDSSRRVFRGEPAFHTPSRCRSSHRFAFPHTLQGGMVGFRVVLPVDAVKQQLGDIPEAAQKKQTYQSGEWIDVIPLMDPELDKSDRIPVGKNEWRIEDGELLVGQAGATPHELIFPLDGAWMALILRLSVNNSLRHGNREVRQPELIPSPLTI